MGEVPADLPDVIAASMSLDIEWPHIDRAFIRLVEVLPGYTQVY
jgi:hypothetical protein